MRQDDEMGWHVLFTPAEIHILEAMPLFPVSSDLGGFSDEI